MTDQTTNKPERKTNVELRRKALKVTLPSVALAGGAFALERARSQLQARRTFFPARYPEGSWDPEAYGLAAVDQWFETDDGMALHGWWIRHDDARGTVLFCHGNTGSIADQMIVYRQLLRLGVNVFAFDYRGYGRSTGAPSEAGLRSDVRAAFDHVTGQLAIPAKRIVLFGHSLGGAVAIAGAATRPAAGLVVQSSFTNFREIANHSYARSPLRFLARNGFRSIETIEGLSLPKLIVHGTEDATIPFEMGQRLYEAAPEPKRWLAVPRAGHNNVLRVGRRRYRQAIARFLDDVLG